MNVHKMFPYLFAGFNCIALLPLRGYTGWAIGIVAGLESAFFYISMSVMDSTLKVLGLRPEYTDPSNSKRKFA